MNSSVKNFQILISQKLYELNDTVDNCNEEFKDLWVFSEKYINGELMLKPR